MVTASVVAESIRLDGLEARLAALAWERLPVDPHPGPLPLESIQPRLQEAPGAVLVDGSCYACRLGYCFKPQACRVASVLQEQVWLLDLPRGYWGVLEGITNLASILDCNCLVAVDVGGDVLARGCEAELWSPLADAIGLSASADSPLDRVLIYVQSLGADGELPQGYLLRRLSELHECYEAAHGLTRLELELLRRVASAAFTEASRAPLLAAEGEWGVVPLRGGSRRLVVNPLHLIGWLLDARCVASKSQLAAAVRGTSSLWDAKLELNKLGVYTELDLELDVASRSVSPTEARDAGRAELGWEPCRAGSW